MKAGSQNGNPKLILEGIYKFDAKFSSGYYDKTMQLGRKICGFHTTKAKDLFRKGKLF